MPVPSPQPLVHPMPRKAWKQKNRYCWNSNLNEEMFLVLLRLYCTGYTCSHAARIIARYGRRYSREKISRQTVNRYYLMFGDYLYELLPDRYKAEHIPLEPDDDMPDDEEARQRYIALVILAAVHQVLYEKLDYDDHIYKIITSNQTFQIDKVLKKLSKSKRGYPLETFSVHFAFCLWYFLIQHIRPGEPTWKALYEVMKEALKAEPLDIRYNRSLRIVKPS